MQCHNLVDYCDTFLQNLSQQHLSSIVFLQFCCSLQYFVFDPFHSVQCSNVHVLREIMLAHGNLRKRDQSRAPIETTSLCFLSTMFNSYVRQFSCFACVIWCSPEPEGGHDSSFWMSTNLGFTVDSCRGLLCPAVGEMISFDISIEWKKYFKQPSMEVSSFHGGAKSRWQPSIWTDSLLGDRSSAAYISYIEELVNKHVAW